MGNPWDRPPLPTQGNRSIRILFEAIGRTLNAWEEIEVEMAHTYSAFAAGERFDAAANRAYGEPSNFVSRLAGLQRVAQTYFVACPSQEVEGELERLFGASHCFRPLLLALRGAIMYS